MIWRDPFTKQISIPINCSLIKTLLACLNDDEISSLIPSPINLNTIPPLFEYGEFIRKINHDCFVEHARTLLESLNGSDYTDYEVQKLINSIYNMIFRKSSVLQEFEINVTKKNYVDLPRFSIFTLGIRNLKSLTIFNLDLISNDIKHQNTSQFLDMITKNCNCIVNFELWIKSPKSVFAKKYLDIIKLQPLKKVLLYIDNPDKISFNLGLEFRSETLKELVLDSIDFQQINLSFIPKLKYLEILEFLYCKGFNNCEVLSGNNLFLKEFKLWYCNTGTFMEKIIRYLCGESLLKLTLSNVTLKAVNAVKVYCPNINFLCIRFNSRTVSNSIIPLICDLSFLKILNIGSNFGIDMVSFVKNLGIHLTYVEYLFFDFNVDLQAFIHFSNNCNANLKKWIITLDNNSLCKNYLTYVIDFQKVHKSLKSFGIKKYGYSWMNEEIEIIDELKNQGINVVSSDELDYLFY
jgi:hypothetical protein